MNSSTLLFRVLHIKPCCYGMSAAGNDGAISELDTCSSDEVSLMKLGRTV